MIPSWTRGAADHGCRSPASTAAPAASSRSWARTAASLRSRARSVRYCSPETQIIAQPATRVAAASASPARPRRGGAGGAGGALSRIGVSALPASSAATITTGANTAGSSKVKSTAASAAPAASTASATRDQGTGEAAAPGVRVLHAPPAQAPYPHRRLVLVARRELAREPVHLVSAVGPVHQRPGAEARLARVRPLHRRQLSGAPA